MTRRGSAWLLGAVAGLAWAGLVAADENIRGAGVERTIDCAGGDVTISGSGHNLTLTGRCPRVTMSGTGSVLHVEELGRLTLSGVNQRVEWVQGLDGATPRITKSGIGNEVIQVKGGAAVRSGGSRHSSGGVQAGPGGTTVESDGAKVTIGANGVTVQDAAGTTTTVRGGRDKDKVTVKSGDSTVAVDGTAGTVTVAGGGATVRAKGGSVVVVENDQERAYDCAGGTATIQSNDNELTLRNCPELIVNGNRNTLTLEGGVKLIRVLGNANRITWSEGINGRAPNVESLGNGNTVSRSAR
jgi:hypothetical protein